MSKKVLAMIAVGGFALAAAIGIMGGFALRAEMRAHARENRAVEQTDKSYKKDGMTSGEKKKNCPADSRKEGSKSERSGEKAEKGSDTRSKKTEKTEKGERTQKDRSQTERSQKKNK